MLKTYANLALKECEGVEEEAVLGNMILNKKKSDEIRHLRSWQCCPANPLRQMHS